MRFKTATLCLSPSFTLQTDRYLLAPPPHKLHLVLDTLISFICKSSASTSTVEAVKDLTCRSSATAPKLFIIITNSTSVADVVRGEVDGTKVIVLICDEKNKIRLQTTYFQAGSHSILRLFLLKSILIPAA